MIISSRTPEGSPERCPVCGKLDRLERSDPTGEFICPSCGSLFVRLRDRLIEWGMLPDKFSLLIRIDELVEDSLDIVEWIMEIEEEYEITIPDQQAANIGTVADFIRYIAREIRRREEDR
ncbi:MAG: phosphopantetheine-binding protein [Gemmataceae bacterium]